MGDHVQSQILVLVWVHLASNASSVHVGNNCAFYDLTDGRLSKAQRFILDGGVWGSEGLMIHHARLATLEQLRAEYNDNRRTDGAAKL